MSKKIGLVAVILGALVLAFSFPAARKIIGMAAGIKGIPDLYLSIAGAVLLIVGVLMLRSPSRAKEVPIYQGEKVVGYRQMK